MDKLLIFCALWSISHGAYMSRMSSISRFRGPTAFRPGVILQRPNIFPPRMMPASHRTPFVVYRNLPHRYAIKPMAPVTTRNVFGIPWKTTARIPVPVPVTPEYDFARTAASAQPVIRTDAPNLSLSEKPIVVAEVLTSENRDANIPADGVKSTYEVTEKITENPTYDVQAKIETPTGFYKSNSGVNYEFKNNEPPQQYSPEYGLIQVQQQMSSITPQEFTVQRYNGLPSHQDLIHSGAEGIIIPPNALLQSDPLFLQKLQTQLLQRYPAVEFIPYNPAIQAQIPPHNQESQPSYYSQNEHFIKQAPMAFVPSDGNRNIVQRETQEGTVQSLPPQSFIPSNITENPTIVTTTNPPETTISNVVTEPQITTTTERIEVNSENERSNPIYYSQIGQTGNNDKVNSYYSAINDIKETSPKEEVNKNFDKSIVKSSESTTIIATSQESDATHYLDNKDKPEANEILHVYKNFIASPFEKPAESVNIVYSLLRRTSTAPTEENKEQNVTTTTEKSVETTANTTKDNQRERSLLNRQPIRFTLTEKRSADSKPQQVVKAKIPPKSKLIFDDKTGEPILRVYASYVDNPARKEVITQKLTNMRHLREVVPKKQENPEHFDAATVNALASDVNQFGQKIKSRNDAARQILLDEYN
ncbi:uncharacterized protein LOC119840553 isoform X2 [Zerene cesonia]|uniref:uncharacterized protein LOC119840553 isoform X2 n=1 Tax=Zerene cesonia TaxID=33412 RepID=UPI0018E59CEF|nr:uncharacterized protein LOC119840553 isoform X2 [Zerene cesonia]